MILRTSLLLTCLCCALFAIPTSSAQEFVTPNIMRASDSQPTEFSIESLSWLEGVWRGDALGGTAEEIWAPLSGGTMMGLFKLTRDGETVFSEIMSIVPNGNNIKLILKHFNADLTGWEEKDEVESFDFVASNDSTVFFDGLTIRRNSTDGITIFVLMTKEDGSSSELVFEYTRHAAF